MSDIIQLLPDHIANQIAAGEVIQRPASLIKELLENSVDAGATKIELHIKDSGRTLVQVIDNGKGMSETDARLCFERHATSKLQSADDLFKITTMGFRGEALASIAAVAHVEMKTKTAEREIGTKIIIEGTQVKEQTLCQFQTGTSISVKNLFFNVPARRNFLKSDNIEFNHILDEFNRVALINHSINFSLFHNAKKILQLNESNFKLRIINLMGKSFNEKLIPIEHNSNDINIYGFIGKPETARKTRGEQFFFVNKRFIKNSYLHNAIGRAFAELIPERYFPSYFIDIELEPQNIDVNIHPTKTEIKFLDDKILYAIINSSVKKSLSTNNFTPSIEFNPEQYFNFSKMPEGYQPKPPTININPEYNPFSNPNPSNKQKIDVSNFDIRHSSNSQNWKNLYDFESDKTAFDNNREKNELYIDNYNENGIENSLFQLFNKYIITKIKTGILLIDQQAAHERILFEKYLNRINNSPVSIQQLLFPQTIQFSPSDFEIIKEIKNELHKLGFEIDDFGKNTIIINGTPSDLEEEKIKTIFDGIIENYKLNQMAHQQEKNIIVAQSFAKVSAVKEGQKLEQIEMQNIIDELFACSIPDYTQKGKKTFITITIENISKLFN